MSGQEGTVSPQQVPCPLTAERAGEWIRRWELQQQRYACDRETRFTVIADVVEAAVAGVSRPLVADLGCGPGSLAARLAGRLPQAEVVGVDTDPVLLALGRAYHGGRVRFADVRVGEPGWTERLEPDRPLDAVVSATALHYLPEPVLLSVYERVREALRPGGVLVNGDHLFQEHPVIAALAGAVGRRHAERNEEDAHEDWRGWWEAAAAAPELADPFAERARRGPEPGGDNGLTLRRHERLLHAAGFEAVGPVWQYGPSCVLVAVRGD
ncbi:class I SAM-dependent methyltransferase [Streptomyces somaliensis DSM 40738]|uniref:Class I SAM-dependent methyltransferase n=1 Tax=Streptomyces somaliensis (strain ATCC 33201 / DSM 40738 / JCM 12659 / KCTC 9044 / NCTC 11332 / NRRL B-12077 / IP 733) TaxID=1134445 RepID=A0AA44DHX7_STRE0|nr:class I SAM-dependent methyltransferase [Streptomyces somaliensis]MCQ0025153.1 class I SAM-dependent methyltransferase [Streptomyces somaliensis DSM 40738]NKY16767.1 class I SAM-dependent methyltransferase [Streptomyces somaliensis DSM 40738]